MSFDGPYPLRTEITVLSADDPKERTIGLPIYERLGTPIGFTLNPEGRPVPLKSKEDLCDGATILVPGLEGAHTMIARDSNEEPYRFSAHFPDGSGSSALLSFGDDAFDPCWCVIAWVSKGYRSNKMELPSDG